MADPTNYVPRWSGGPLPVLPPVQPPAPSAFVPRYSGDPGVATGARVVPAVVAQPQPASNAMAGMGTPPAPATPVAPPAAAPTSAVSGLPNIAGAPLGDNAGPGAKVVVPPLPPGMLSQVNGAGYVPLPGGPMPGAAPAAAGPTPQQVRGAIGGGNIADGGIQVDRGGVTSRYDQQGNLVSGPGGQGEAQYNSWLAGAPGATNPVTALLPAAPAYNPAAAPGGGAGMVGGGGGGGLQNPFGQITAGFDQQTARANDFIGRAMDYVNGGDNIFERATRGRFINGLLGATVGPNNIGQVQGQGIDTLNSATAGVGEAGIGAAASEFGSSAQLTGNEQRVGEANTEFNNQAGIPLGTRIVPTQFGPMPTTVYGSRQGGGMVLPTNPTPRPTLTQFLSDAKAGNPSMSETQLTNQYYRQYGR
jgi:hypothetical protein